VFGDLPDVTVQDFKKQKLDLNLILMYSIVKWQGWQNWTDVKLATKLTKDDQQPVLLLPARWWPYTLPQFESEG